MASAFYLPVSCSASKQSIIDFDRSNSTLVSPLPIKKIKSEVETTNFSASSVPGFEYFFSYASISLEASESRSFEHDNDNPNVIPGLRHNIFQEIKFAIDDYGIINYLTLDF